MWLSLYLSCLRQLPHQPCRAGLPPRYSGLGTRRYPTVAWLRPHTPCRGLTRRSSHRPRPLTSWATRNPRQAVNFPRLPIPRHLLFAKRRVARGARPTYSRGKHCWIPWLGKRPGRTGRRMGRGSPAPAGDPACGHAGGPPVANQCGLRPEGIRSGVAIGQGSGSREATGMARHRGSGLGGRIRTDADAFAYSLVGETAMCVCR